MSKSSLLKNARNYAEYLRKKERGPVKAFFHITKNENVPAIEQQGLLTNHPNANINSANHPFRKHGTDAGGVWVTTEPTAFPVYGTTVGGKNGNAAARADALSTIKIEVPLPELRKMKAVQDPYGKNILRKGDDPRAVEKFPTWAGIDVPTTVLLNDVKPQWLKNIGYVEERNPGFGVNNPMGQLLDFGLDMLPRIKYGNLRDLSKADRHAFSLLTGHDASRAPKVDLEKSPARFVKEYLEKNRPIRDRAPKFPRPELLEYAARKQGASSGPNYIQDGIATVPAPNEANRYSVDFIPAYKWTEDYRGYTKPGEPIKNWNTIEFAPGAISRGWGGIHMPSIKERNFDWNKYKKLLAEGETPQAAAFTAQPNVKLDWDNIVYHTGTYRPRIIPAHDFDAVNEGAISRGTPYDMKSSARMNKANRVAAGIVLKNAKADAAKYLTSNLGRQPTAEEIDNWARIGLVNQIEGSEADVPPVAANWAYKYNEDIVERLTHELGGD